MKFNKISQERFNAYFYGRRSMARIFATEIDWFEVKTEEVTLLATVLRCEIDKDFNAVILGRDMRKKFRAIDIISSVDSSEELLQQMDSRIEKLVASHVDGYFPQGDDNDQLFALFTHRLPEAKRNHYIKLLSENPDYFPAQVMLEELAYWFKDPDGTFIRAMQGNEFNARLFELYLHAMFYELDFEFDRTHAQPDYLLTKAGMTIAVEAVTVAEMEDEKNRKIQLTDEESKKLFNHVNEDMPFKFSRALRKKVAHRPEPANLPYWELPHTKGKPFVIAIHDYSRTMSMSFSEPALRSLLYGIVAEDDHVFKIEKHTKSNGDTISSDFFGHENNKHVSAVLLATQATLSKFNRMGRVAGLRSPTTFAFVKGVRTDHDYQRKQFRMLVEHPQYKELWCEGVYVYHNPNAETPLDPSLFANVVNVFMDNDGINEFIPRNYTLQSVTEMVQIPAESIKRFWEDIDSGREPRL
ncbi:hypothetical protein [Massilia sp.]|uniref:hypothetical protein n=1 Tax=Massilia sp. TaxID=1882437 RepID=UPI00352DCA7A